MGFCSITCGKCEGSGRISVPFPAPLNRGMKLETCPDCGGTGSHIIHTGQIGSYQLSVDPGHPDGSWAVMWEKMEDGTLVIHDFDLVPTAEPTKKVFTPTEGNPAPHVYRCTSGLGENCSCYACHGG